MQGPRSRRALQLVLGVLSFIPLAACGVGVFAGAGALSGAPVEAELDNQFRYLSGYYLTLSLLLWWMVPNIERHAVPLRLICIGLAAGGVGRLLSMAWVGPGSAVQVAGVGLELGAPVLLLWQHQVRLGYGAITVTDPERSGR